MVYHKIRIYKEPAHSLTQTNEEIFTIFKQKPEFELHYTSVFKLRKLAPVKAGIDNKKEILLESYLLNFKNLPAVIVIPALLTPGINASI